MEDNNSVMFLLQPSLVYGSHVLSRQVFLAFEEEEYTVKTWYHIFFQRRNNLPALIFLQVRTTLLIPSGVQWKPLSHTETWYNSLLSTKCRKGNTFLGCKTAVSDSCCLWVQTSAGAWTSVWWGWETKIHRCATWPHAPAISHLPSLWSQQFYSMIFKYGPNYIKLCTCLEKNMNKCLSY